MALVAAGLVFGQSSFYLKDGDRVVFYGDSITDQRLYTTFSAAQAAQVRTAACAVQLTALRAGPNWTMMGPTYPV
jgi:hypothetical protein